MSKYILIKIYHAYHNFKTSAKFRSIPATLWCEYSILKATLRIEEDIDTTFKVPKFRAFMKKKNDGHKPKKSNVFAREEINKFGIEADDSNFLLMKVVTAMGTLQLPTHFPFSVFLVLVLTTFTND